MIFAHDTEVALAAAAALVNTSPEADRACRPVTSHLRYAHYSNVRAAR